jgi:hypothetical protein
LGGGAISVGRPIRIPERGGSKINTLLTLLILGGLIFTGVKIVPAMFAKFQLQDAIETESRFAIVNHKGEDEIREDVWKKMQELGIPATREAIRVSVAQRDVTISVDYTVPVDLQVYKFNLEFHPHADNHTL